MTELVLRHDNDGVATLTLNRPEKRNALNHALFHELETHVAALAPAAKEIGAVILRAEGPTFCAGMDLSERGLPLPRANFQAKIVTALATLPQPVIVAVQGGCFTGGLELALAGDIIIAADTAYFADTHGKFGLVPIWGMSQRLPRRVGQWKAREMSFTGIPVAADEALRIGLANQVVPEAELETRAAALAATIVAQNRRSVLAYKKLYQEQADLALAPGLAHEVYGRADPEA